MRSFLHLELAEACPPQGESPLIGTNMLEFLLHLLDTTTHSDGEVIVDIHDSRTRVLVTGYGAIGASVAGSCTCHTHVAFIAARLTDGLVIVGVQCAIIQQQPLPWQTLIPTLNGARCVTATMLLT